MSRNLYLLASILLTPALITSTNAWAAGNSSKGKETSAMCQGCHGEDGNSINPDCPTIAGQHPKYIVKQLEEFVSGKRSGTVMGAMAASLSEKDRHDVAAYFTQFQGKAQYKSSSADRIARGKKIFNGGNSYSNIPACASCHGPNGRGNPPAAYPSLVGLSPAYVTKQLQDFKRGIRQNDPKEIMRTVASKLTINEINAVAAYISTLE